MTSPSQREQKSEEMIFLALSGGYKRYLKSPKWMAKRQEKLEEADYECELCGKHGCTLQVHHLNYDNIFNEESEDLLVVCKPCHKYADRIRKTIKRILKLDNDFIERAVNSKLEKTGYSQDFTGDRKDLKELSKTLKEFEENIDFFEELQENIDIQVLRE